MSLVAGTGVACLAVPRDGTARIIGGHGYLLGDEGGAFWIGRAGLRAVLRARDGRGRRRPWSPPRRTASAASTTSTCASTTMPRAVNAIAQFAPRVLEAAEAGDAVAPGSCRRDAGAGRARASRRRRGGRPRTTWSPSPSAARCWQPGTPLRGRLEADARGGAARSRVHGPQRRAARRSTAPWRSGSPATPAATRPRPRLARGAPRMTDRAASAGRRYLAAAEDLRRAAARTEEWPRIDAAATLIADALAARPRPSTPSARATRTCSRRSCSTAPAAWSGSGRSCSRA